MPRQTSPVIRHVPLTQARASLGNLVNDVNRDGEYVVVERGGLPVAVIIDFDEFEDYLDLRDPAVRERIAEASREHRAGQSSPAEDLLPRLRRVTAAGRRRRKPAAGKR
jgi:prevent-host-death family protein